MSDLITSQQNESSTETKPKKKQWLALVCIALIGIGIFFRFYGIENKEFWHDEVLTTLHVAGFKYNWVEWFDGSINSVKSINDKLTMTKSTDVENVISSLALIESEHPPLFYVASYFVSGLMGQTVFALRCLAGVFGLIQIPAAYFLTLQLFRNQKAAWLAAAFIALSPAQISYAQEAREYSLMVSCFLVVTYLFFKALEKNDFGSWFEYFIATCVGFYSASFLIICNLSQLLYVFLTKTYRRSRRYINVGLVGIISVFLYWPWLKTAIDNVPRSMRGLDWLKIPMPLPELFVNWVNIAAASFFDLGKNLNIYTDMVSVNGLLLAFVLAVSAWSLFALKNVLPRIRGFIFLTIVVYVSPFLIPDLVSGGIRTTCMRYFLNLIALSCVIVAFALGRQLDSSQKWKKLLSVCVIAALVGTQVYSNIIYSQSSMWHRKSIGNQSLRLASAAINSPSGKTLLVCDSSNGSNLHQVLALSLRLKPDIKMQWFDHYHEHKLVSGFDHIFLFNVSSQFKKSLKDQGYGIKQVDEMPYLMEVKQL